MCNLLFFQKRLLTLFFYWTALWAEFRLSALIDRKSISEDSNVIGI